MNVPGAGGTIGLAQFAGQNSGNPNALIVGGYVMVGAILTNQSPVTLKDVTPIARLTGEYEAIVVPTSSDIKTMADLVAKLKADPGSVSWAGGSAGGTDHIAVGLIAKASGVDPTKINYVAFSGGGEALAAILGGQVTAGISGYGEFESQVKAGQLSLLAVSARHRRRRAARHRAGADRRAAAADHLQARPGRIDDHVRRHLLRRHVWRLDHGDPAQHARRKRLASATALEGNKMAKAGRGGPALATSAIGSFVAGTIATLGSPSWRPGWSRSRSSSVRGIISR
jgi:hypothetical protein